MPNRRPKRIRLVLLLALLACASAASGRTVVIYPLQDTVVREKGGMVVGYCDDQKVYEIVVEINGKKHEIALWDGVFDVETMWAKGENTVTVQGNTIKFTCDAWADEDAGASVHQAAYDNCGNCHQLGESRDLKRKAASDKLCEVCHEPDPAGFEHRTSKVACSRCHVPHAAPRPHLLRLPQAPQCLDCHKNLQAGLETPHEPPLQQLDCLKCHFRPLLNGLCHGCHLGQARKGASVHSAAVEKRACIVCHVPHATDTRELTQACKGCHGKMESLLPGHERVVAEGCGACHSMHDVADTSKKPATACGTCHPGPRTRLCGGGTDPCTKCHRVHGKEAAQEGAQSVASPPP